MSGTHAGAVAPSGLDVSQTADATSEPTPRPGDTGSPDDRAGDTGSGERQRRDAQIQERREQRRRRATELARRVTTGLFPRSGLDDNLLGELAARITQTADADGCDVVRFRIGQPSVLYRAWCGSTVLPRTRSRVARARPREAPGIEVRLLPASTAFPQVGRPAGATTCVHVLIRDQRTGGAETLGLLTAYRTTPQSFSAEDVAMLDVIADLLGTEFARAGADHMKRTRRRPSAPASAGA